MRQISNETKTSAKKYVMDGRSCKKISKIVGVSHATINRIAKKLNFVSKRSKNGRPSNLLNARQSILRTKSCEITAKLPEKLETVYKKIFGIVVSTSTIYE